MSRRIINNGVCDSPYHIQLKQRMSSTPVRQSGADENRQNGEDNRKKPFFCIENSPSMKDVRLSRDFDGSSHFQ